MVGMLSLIQADTDSGLRQIESALAEALGIPTPTLDKILLSLVVMLSMGLVHRVARRVIESRVESKKLQFQWMKAAGYSTFFVGLLLIGGIWIEGLRQMGTFFGLLSAGLAIALKDLVADLAGWAFIVWRRPFSVGDRIEIGQDRGDVVDIRPFQFSLLEIGNWVDADQSTGRVIHVPNAHVLSHAVANYTAEFPFVWHEIPVLLTFESDWRRARVILRELLAEHTAEVSEKARETTRRAIRKLFITYPNVDAIVYLTVRDSGVLLTMRYLTEPRARRGREQAIWEAVLDAFDAEPSIELAYPTFRVYRQGTDIRDPSPNRPQSGEAPGREEPSGTGGSGRN